MDWVHYCRQFPLLAALMLAAGPLSAAAAPALDEAEVIAEASSSLVFRKPNLTVTHEHKPNGEKLRAISRTCDFQFQTLEDPPRAVLDLRAVGIDRPVSAPVEGSALAARVRAAPQFGWTRLVLDLKPGAHASAAAEGLPDKKGCAAIVVELTSGGSEDQQMEQRASVDPGFLRQKFMLTPANPDPRPAASQVTIGNVIPYAGALNESSKAVLIEASGNVNYRLSKNGKQHYSLLLYGAVLSDAPRPIFLFSLDKSVVRSLRMRQSNGLVECEIYTSSDSPLVVQSLKQGLALMAGTGKD